MGSDIYSWSNSYYLFSTNYVRILSLFTVLRENLPEGFEECISYKMPSYVVPHSIFPQGYHCNPQEPLPFIFLASQKNFLALYHMGIYAIPELLQRFTEQYILLNIGKLDMGKSCIRFKNIHKIPYSLLEELCKKVTVDHWIQVYLKSRELRKS